MHKNRLKVALVSFDFGEYCIRLASALAQYTRICLLLPEKQSEPYLSKLDPAVDLQPFRKPRLRQPVRQVRMIHTILRRIRRFDPAVIHLQHRHLWFNLALPLLRRYPVVVTIHDPRHHPGDRSSSKTPEIIAGLGYALADQVIVHGQRLKEMVASELHIAREIVHVVPMIALGDGAARTEVEEDPGVLLFFGRIWPYKGLEYLIRAEPLISAQVPDAKIVIAGQGEDFGRYRRMMVHPERFVVHNEYVSDDKRAELFRRASVVVLPYVEASQSAVIPVAYTFGKPVVATTVGGLPEMVENGRTGLLVPPRDERALADAIVRLLRDRDLRHQLGDNGKRKINTECSPDAVARQTLAAYRCATDGRGPRTQRISGSVPSNNC